MNNLREKQAEGLSGAPASCAGLKGKRVAILTIWSFNLGNRLQNYALQQTLAAWGCAVETLRREDSSVPGVKRRLRYLLRNDRLNACRRFDDEFISLSQARVCPGNSTPGLDARYDAFVIGSDQVWNPTFSFNGDDDYLPGVPARRKCSYAASFGIDDAQLLPPQTARLLRGIGSISVREEAGAEIVRLLTGEAPFVALDPVLLRPPAEWRGIARAPRDMGDGAYVLTYLLGANAEQEAIAAFAAEQGFRVIDLSDDGLPLGPCEFVWLIDHAQRVFTDSFHAVAFSILLHTPFVALSRQSGDANMSSRFATLLGALGQASRMPAAAISAFADDAWDWAPMDARLERLREESLSWLARAVEGCA